MRLQVMSDIHCEHHNDWGMNFLKELDLSHADGLVLAGDIFGNIVRFRDHAEKFYAELMAKNKDVYFCLGNHEYWSSDRIETENAIRAIVAKHPKLHLLETGKSFQIGERKIHGDTMWFPHHPMNWQLERNFSDFSRIQGLNTWCYQRYQQFREYIRVNLQKGDLVMTHHLPSYGSVATAYIGDKFNRFYIGPMEDLICQKEPAYWIHGHTHHQFSYTHHQTKILANPKGYPNEPTSATFNPKLIIDV